MKTAGFFLVVLCCSFSLAQSAYKGKVIAGATEVGIPYVNIGIISKGIGTISDEEGLFIFLLKPEAMLLRIVFNFLP